MGLPTLLLVFSMVIMVTNAELTKGQQKVYLDKHNKLRKTVNAGNMYVMTWNNDLAAAAEAQAKECRMYHPPYPRPIGDYRHTGQNVAISYDPVEEAVPVQSWYDEIQDFTYPNECSGGCGHFTQIVWGETKELGCGANFCGNTTCDWCNGKKYPNSTNVVCNYGPSGNTGKPPYIEGEPCTTCDSGFFWCRDGLCDDSCASNSTGCECNADCKNSGIVDSTSCSCTCVNDWQGVDCGTCPKCEDGYTNCGDLKAGCGRWQNVIENCKKTCGTCPDPPEGC